MHEKRKKTTCERNNDQHEVQCRDHDSRGVLGLFGKVSCNSHRDIIDEIWNHITELAIDRFSYSLFCSKRLSVLTTVLIMYWYQDWQWRRPRKTWGIRRCLFLVTHYESFLLSIVNPWIVTGSPTTLLNAFRSLDKDLAGLKNLAKFEALNVKTRHARDQLRQDASCDDCRHVRISHTFQFST